MMEVFDKNGNKVELIQGIQDINITPNEGYELLYNYSYATNEYAFVIVGIKKMSGYFDLSDEVCLKTDINLKLGTSFCGLGSDSDWMVNKVAYVFINSNSIIVNDYNNSKTSNRAYINLVCRLL